MMGQRLSTRSGDEFDAITRWRHALIRFRRPGVTSQIKRGMRRRERRHGRQVVESELATGAEPDFSWAEIWETEDWMGEYPWDQRPTKCVFGDGPLRVPLREVIHG